MADIKLLLADVDGTLVTRDKVLTDRAIAAVKAMGEHGIRFAVTSGRPPKGMNSLIAPLAISTPLAGFNGGLWVNPDQSVIEARTLSREVAEKSVTLLIEAGLDAWVYTGEEWLLRDKSAPHAAREEWTVKFAPRVVTDFGDALSQAVKIVGCSDDIPLMEKTEKAVQEALGSGASAARSQPYYLDITHPEANKGFALKYLSKHLGIPTENIATIGDQPNDVLMFREGGFSIAMGNASEWVQSQASAVTASCEDEGFAKAVEKYILKTAPADTAHG